MTLEDFGWNAFHAEAFKPFAKPGIVPARVAIEHRGGYQIVTPELGLVPATVTGRLRHALRNNAERPVVGDWVAVQLPKGENKAVIHYVTQRRTKLSRNSAGNETDEQILASNIDVVFVLASLASDLNVRRIERYVAVAADSGAKVVLLLTKADLVSDADADSGAGLMRKAIPGLSVIVISTVRKRGYKEVLTHLNPRDTTVLIGPSGVGKSSLINRICGEEMLPVQEVREDDQKGRHTTTQRELMPLPNGALAIDTPGIRELQIWITEAELAEAFGDIEALSLRCKFTTCRHADDPGCAVRAALESGALPADRLEHYFKLKGEAATLRVRRQGRVAVQESRVKKRLVFKRDEPWSKTGN